MLRFLDRTVDEPDDGERRHAAREVGFHLDAPRLQADQRVRERTCEHVANLGTYSGPQRASANRRRDQCAGAPMADEQRMRFRATARALAHAAANAGPPRIAKL